MDKIFSHSQYELRRVFFKVFGKALEISADGEKLLYCEQKPFKLKEDIRIYADPDKEKEILRLKAKKIIDFSGAYDIIDSSEKTVIGTLKRKGFKSTFIRDTWTLSDPQGNQIAEIKEDRLAILRRMFRLVSFVFPQRIDIISEEKTVAFVKQRFTFLVYGTYLKIEDDSFDRRLGLAIQIIQACIEGRQRS